MPHGIRLFVGGVAVSFGGMVLLGVVNYLIRRTLSQELPKPDFGFFYSMFALANLLTMLFQFGVKQAKTILIANFMARGQKKRINPLASSILFFTMTGSTMLCLGLLLAKSWLLEHFFKYPGGGTAYTIFLLYIFALPIWGILLSIPHGMKNFPLYYGLSILQMGAILCGCLCSAPRWGLNGVSAVWAASMLGTLLFAAWKIYSVYRIRISPRLALSRRICRKIWELCSWMSLSLAGIMLIGNLDTVCLTYLSTLDSVANYNIALPIVQIIQSLLVLPFVFMPIASSMWQQKALRGNPQNLPGRQSADAGRRPSDMVSVGTAGRMGHRLSLRLRLPGGEAGARDPRHGLVIPRHRAIQPEFAEFKRQPENRSRHRPLRHCT